MFASTTPSNHLPITYFPSSNTTKCISSGQPLSAGSDKKKTFYGKILEGELREFIQQQIVTVQLGEESTVSLGRLDNLEFL